MYFLFNNLSFSTAHFPTISLNKSSHSNIPTISKMPCRGGIYHGSLSFGEPSYSTSVLENMPLNSVILTVITNRQSDKRVQYYIEQVTPVSLIEFTRLNCLIIGKITELFSVKSALNTLMPFRRKKTLDGRGGW